MFFSPVCGTVAAVREHTETVIEVLLGAPVDCVPASTFTSPSYVRLHGRYHSPLSRALAQFTGALGQVMAGEAAAVSPSTVHVAISSLLEKLREDVATAPFQLGPPLEVVDTTRVSYEDVLATTVINKVVMEQETSSPAKEEKAEEPGHEEGGDQGPRKGDEGRGRLARESSREAGSGSSGLRRSVASYSSSSCLTQPAMVQHVDFVTVHSHQESDDNSSSSSSSSSSSRPSSILSVDSSMPSAASSPLISARRPDLVICEQVEEVETVYSEPESPLLSPRPPNSLENQPHKVLFPELGLDLVEGEGEEEEHSLALSLSSWQDNWLFKRSQRGEAGQEGVTMLVPNPSSVAKAQIGNRDFDLVSELSERQSVGSFEISSSSEDDFEEEDGEEGLEEDERDQEYTIYSVLPNR